MDREKKILKQKKKLFFYLTSRFPQPVMSKRKVMDLFTMFCFTTMYIEKVNRDWTQKKIMLKVYKLCRS